MIYPRYISSAERFALRETKDSLLMVALALHAYRVDKGYYPPNLTGLVPNYLTRIPLDPFSQNQALHYEPVPVRYVTGTWSEFHQGPSPISMGIPGPMDVGGPQRSGTSLTKNQYSQVPFKLYSGGFNSVDDGGAPFEDLTTSNMAKRYKINPGPNKLDKSDIVAGINH